MKIVIQRVSRASVTIDGQVKSAIGKGYMILLGVAEGDTSEDVDWLVKKVASLRVFDDEQGVMNIPITAINGEILVISREIGRQVGTGEFGADMKVELVNDGPVTICMDTRHKE